MNDTYNAVDFPSASHQRFQNELENNSMVTCETNLIYEDDMFVANYETIGCTQESSVIIDNNPDQNTYMYHKIYWNRIKKLIRCLTVSKMEFDVCMKLYIAYKENENVEKPTPGKYSKQTYTKPPVRIHHNRILRLCTTEKRQKKM